MHVSYAAVKVIPKTIAWHPLKTNGVLKRKWTDLIQEAGNDIQEVVNDTTVEVRILEHGITRPRDDRLIDIIVTLDPILEGEILQDRIINVTDTEVDRTLVIEDKGPTRDTEDQIQDIAEGLHRKTDTDIVIIPTKDIGQELAQTVKNTIMTEETLVQEFVLTM